MFPTPSIYLLFSCLVFSIALDAAPAMASDEAILFGIEGQIFVMRNGNALTPNRGLRLQNGDRISGSENSKATILYRNGNKVTVDNSNSHQVGGSPETIGQKAKKRSMYYQMLSDAFAGKSNESTGSGAVRGQRGKQQPAPEYALGHSQEGSPEEDQKPMAPQEFADLEPCNMKIMRKDLEFTWNAKNLSGSGILKIHSPKDSVRLEHPLRDLSVSNIKLPDATLAGLKYDHSYFWSLRKGVDSEEEAIDSTGIESRKCRFEIVRGPKSPNERDQFANLAEMTDLSEAEKRDLRIAILNLEGKK